MYKSENLYFEPNIFVNYLSRKNFKSKKISIDNNNFRKTNFKRKKKKLILYLLGCCTFFEKHLFSSESLAGKLDKGLKKVKILNPSMSHYTQEHLIHRLIYDLNKKTRIDFILNQATVNDVLVYIHHKNFKVKNDKSHLYKSFYDIKKYNFTKKIPSYLFQLIILLIKTGSVTQLFSYESHFYSINPNYSKYSNYSRAKKNFNFSDLEANLEILLSICKHFKIKLFLATFSYYKKDFLYEPRKTYLEGIKKINQIYRNFSKKNNIDLIDFEKKLEFNNSDIKNKWHFTNDGNKKRSDFVIKKLNKFI